MRNSRLPTEELSTQKYVKKNLGFWRAALACTWQNPLSLRELLGDHLADPGTKHVDSFLPAMTPVE